MYPSKCGCPALLTHIQRLYFLSPWIWISIWFGLVFEQMFSLLLPAFVDESALAIPLHWTMKTGIAFSVVNGLRIEKEDRTSAELWIWNLLNCHPEHHNERWAMNMMAAWRLEHKKSQYAFYADLFLYLRRFNIITIYLHINKIIMMNYVTFVFVMLLAWQNCKTQEDSIFFSYILIFQ